MNDDLPTPSPEVTPVPSENPTPNETFEKPEPVDPFKSLTTCVIDSVAAMKAEGEGFLLCVLVKQVPDLAIPGPGEPAGQRLMMNVLPLIGGKTKYPPKIALITALQRIFVELPNIEALRLTPQDISQILGVQVKEQSGLVLPGDPRFMGGRRMS